MAAPKATSVVVFKVTLKEKKSIWRRIAVRVDQTLDDLHEAIFKAFDRYDEHLYSFYFLKPKSPATARFRPLPRIEYAHPMCLEGPFGSFGVNDMHNAVETKIRDLKLAPGKEFEYLFDFGDCWEHIIKVEATDIPAEKGKYPRMLESRGESPPQYPDFDEDEEDDDSE